MKHYPIHYPSSIIKLPLLILLGKPASGKGIQGRMLCEDVKYQIINVGNILREKSEIYPEIKSSTIKLLQADFFHRRKRDDGVHRAQRKHWHSWPSRN